LRTDLGFSKQKKKKPREEHNLPTMQHSSLHEAPGLLPKAACVLGPKAGLHAGAGCPVCTAQGVECVWLYHLKLWFKSSSHMPVLTSSVPLGKLSTSLGLTYLVD
jgi:hypothetical protein